MQRLSLVANVTAIPAVADCGLLNYLSRPEKSLQVNT